jgi:hypothetical protein
MYPSDEDRPSWMDRAEHDNPEVFQEAVVKAFEALRNPVIAAILLTSSQAERTKIIRDCIKTAYDGMLADMQEA